MNTYQLAVLIDGENISPTWAEEIRRKADLLGQVSMCQVFGDFRRPNTPRWNSLVVDALGFKLVQVSRPYRGSNSADEAIFRAAREIVEQRRADAVCVASGDGDFCKLAEEMIAACIPCYVIGNEYTSRRLQSVCTRFFRLGANDPTSQVGELCQSQICLLRAAVMLHANKHGWANIQAVARYLKSRSARYRADRWGFASISKLIRATGEFELKEFPKSRLRAKAHDALNNLFTNDYASNPPD
ncbi:NYN domain-containing protein [Adhaeretor mobilis]|uniref:NYN domain protein n=1 Tax=Adhaeretor mobilis TaxID=1930276 RepID=A0A517MQN6_9BACT|nr:NYN domain-containing protein [Adhaeretor mobilis]QDS97195.1 NYN domain protein [Adhaeretor mobilis]